MLYVRSNVILVRLHTFGIISKQLPVQTPRKTLSSTIIKRVKPSQKTSSLEFTIDLQQVWLYGVIIGQHILNAQILWQLPLVCTSESRSDRITKRTRISTIVN